VPRKTEPTTPEPRDALSLAAIGLEREREDDPPPERQDEEDEAA
jgi:hypothetical protein